MATPLEKSKARQDEDPAPLTKQEIVGLRAKLSPELQDEEWYTILTAATASAKAGPEAIPLIYELASEGLGNSPTDKEADEKAVRIQRRIKETLLKGTVLYGIAPALDSAFALAKIIRKEVQEHPGRKDSGFFQRRGQTLEEINSRGTDHLRRIYRHNLDDIYEKFGDDMDDLRFLTFDINYAWNLSEVGVLNFKSTELVILAALILQNARSEILWHLRGARRAGWSDECVTSVREVCVELGQRLGCRTSKVPQLGDVREDSNE
jgi:alkylhydroperoxidase/carboxymuconolactone decarboxylase family protein YurZ